MTYIDLTHPFTNDIPVSDYDTPPSIKRIKTLNQDAYNDSVLTTTMHIGTHIDAPSHMTSFDVMVSDYDIDKFIGPGVVLDFTNHKQITLREEDKKRIVPGTIVLVHTGMSKLFGTEEYYNDHPILTTAFCEYLVKQKVKIVALDFYSPDTVPFDCHKILLQNDVLIVENLCNTDRLLHQTDIILHMIPMKLQAEGAMIRAYAERKDQ